MSRRPSTDTELWCTPCKRMHDRSSFGLNKYSATGLNYACGAVVRKRNARNHAANRDVLNQRHRERRKWRKTSPDAILWAVKKMLYDASRRADLKGIEFAITPEDLETPKVCPLLGIPLVYQAAERRVSGSASLDRINGNRGYTVGNCWIISWRANRIKTDATPEELMSIATALNNRCVGKKAAGRELDGRTWDEFPAPDGAT